MFSCDQCGEAFTENHNLTRHKESKHAAVKYSCDKCNYTANRRDNLSRHMKTKHRRIDADQNGGYWDDGDIITADVEKEKSQTGGDVGGEHDVEHEPHIQIFS